MLFNDCVYLAHYLPHFKKLIIIVLQKASGKELCHYFSAKAYRPIVLLNTLGKKVESVLAIHISYWVEIYALLLTNILGEDKVGLLKFLFMK